MSSKDIVLAAVNARYSHASLGIRSLRANLGPLRDRSRLMEFDLGCDPDNAAARILEDAPRILALGIYVWNAPFARRILPEIRRHSPRTRILLGGPEIAGDPDPFWRGHADHLLRGEGERSFAEACAALADGRTPGPAPESPPDPATLEMADAEYSDGDLATRTTYVEATRGCPYTCDYCLSAGDGPIRVFPEDRVFASLDRLLKRGARRIKFVDRSFNADPDHAGRQLAFWLARPIPGLRVQYEAIPERFPARLRDLLRPFPADRLRLEIGIQTLDPEVARRIGRPLHPDRVEETLIFLRDETNIAVHADLIAGLPGETLAGFAAGFNRALGWTPAELQVGLLKRLRGARIGRHDETHGMRYSPEPPYELISHDRLSPDEVKRIKRFARFWDRAYNRGILRPFLPALWRDSGHAFEEFLAFSDWAYARFERDWGISLNRLAGALADYLREARRRPDEAGRIRDFINRHNLLARRGEAGL